MDTLRLVTLTAAALAFLAGCTPNPDAPPPGVTPIPAASLPRVPAATTTTESAMPATSATVVPTVIVDQAEFRCRALTEFEDVRVRDLALGLVGAAAVDLNAKGLSLLAVNRSEGRGVRMFLYNPATHRMANVSDQWSGAGYGVQLLHPAAAIATAKACSTSADPPTRR